MHLTILFKFIGRMLWAECMIVLKTRFQLLPYFVITVLEYPGMSGLFVAAIVSSTLRSVSSVQNSLSAVTWQDLLSHWLRKISDARKTAILKLTGRFAVFAAVVLMCQYLAMSVAEHIV